MNRKSLLIASAAGVAAVALAGLVAARADNPGAPRAQPAIARAAPDARDRLLAKAAYTQVLSKKAEYLGMIPAQNLAAYAPIYPDGMILEQNLGAASPTGGSIQYVAAATVPALVAFYQDAAAHQGLPFQVSSLTPDMVLFRAADGKGRLVRARLTRQFDNGTQVDLTYN
jgi:hypothetical protein